MTTQPAEAQTAACSRRGCSSMWHAVAPITITRKDAS